MYTHMYTLTHAHTHTLEGCLCTHTCFPALLNLFFFCFSTKMFLLSFSPLLLLVLNICVFLPMITLPSPPLAPPCSHMIEVSVYRGRRGLTRYPKTPPPPCLPPAPYGSDQGAERRRDSGEGGWHLEERGWGEDRYHGERAGSLTGEGRISGSLWWPARAGAGPGGRAAAVTDTTRPRIRLSHTHHTCTGKEVWTCVGLAVAPCSSASTTHLNRWVKRDIDRPHDLTCLSKWHFCLLMIQVCFMFFSHWLTLHCVCVNVPGDYIILMLFIEPCCLQFKTGEQHFSTLHVYFIYIVYILKQDHHHKKVLNL